jgi:glutamine amidotransferase
MSRSVTVVDYDAGNLFSVCRALEHCGAEVTVTSEPAQLLEADRLILPGVGSFPDGMSKLLKYGLDKAVKEYARSDRPLLGICLGMQMLGSMSEEFGSCAGLGLIEGQVTKVPSSGVNGRDHKIPHIGWTPLKMPSSRESWANTILADVEPGEFVYLLHSFAINPADNKSRLADCDYDGHIISAAIQSGNVYGCQFHPEKSAEVGLKILRRFLM